MSFFSGSAASHAAQAHPSMVSYGQRVSPALVRLLSVLGYGRVFVRAQGMHLWDHSGQEYLDFLSAFGTCNLGHSHPGLLAQVQQFLTQQVPNLMHVGPQPLAAELATELARLTQEQLPMALFSNSGSEAVEAALKLARIATGRQAFLFCAGGYHGNNLGALAVMSDARMRRPFEPLLPGCTQIPYGKIDALAAALRKHKPAALLLEPIQGEGGVVVPEAGYLQACQQLCARHGSLLILDEVQTGIGRTGKMFAYQHEGVVPDILVLAKALGGGLLPIGATLARRDIIERAYGAMDRVDLHGTTMAGNALACATALATLRIVQEEKLCENAAAMGTLLQTLLREQLAEHPLVHSIRGCGLLVGIVLGRSEEKAGLIERLLPGLAAPVTRKLLGQWLSLRLLERGIIAQPATHRWDVLKLVPPLTVQPAQIQRVVSTVSEVLSSYQSSLPLLRDVVLRAGGQLWPTLGEPS